MPAPLILTFVSTVAFAVQLMIFAYLYQSHRVRFFQYLLLAWGAYTLSKGLKLVDVLVLDIDHASFATEVSAVAAFGLTRAAAFAHRWDYRRRGRDVLVGAGVAALRALASVGGGDESQRVVGLGLGAAQMAAGVLFWPSRGRVRGFRGERLLAGLLTLWGVHRIATQFVSTPPGSTGYLAVHAVFITLYFLSTFAVIIMVLERARSESERLHARLREAERLATAGELAAGMAHEIRNPLAAIVNATALLTDEAGLTPDERATTLAAIRTEAMNGRGRLSLEVARQNGDVALAVSDTGPGIPRDRLPRVFEPFYSGKPNGSGLGLTIAERIVVAHGGRIEIDSEPGRGTRVTLLFPLEAA